MLTLQVPSVTVNAAGSVYPKIPTAKNLVNVQIYRTNELSAFTDNTNINSKSSQRQTHLAPTVNITNAGLNFKVAGSLVYHEDIKGAIITYHNRLNSMESKILYDKEVQVEIARTLIRSIKGNIIDLSTFLSIYDFSNRKYSNKLNVDLNVHPDSVIVGLETESRNPDSVVHLLTKPMLRLLDIEFYVSPNINDFYITKFSHIDEIFQSFIRQNHEAQMRLLQQPMIPTQQTQPQENLIQQQATQEVTREPTLIAPQAIPCESDTEVLSEYEHSTDDDDDYESEPGDNDQDNEQRQESRIYPKRRRIDVTDKQIVDTRSISTQSSGGNARRTAGLLTDSVMVDREREHNLKYREGPTYSTTSRQSDKTNSQFSLNLKLRTLKLVNITSFFKPLEDSVLAEMKLLQERDIKELSYPQLLEYQNKLNSKTITRRQILVDLYPYLLYLLKDRTQAVIDMAYIQQYDSGQSCIKPFPLNDPVVTSMKLIIIYIMEFINMKFINENASEDLKDVIHEADYNQISEMLHRSNE